jgi:ABC-type glycerol-3-phosphate transport system substrate-binding protein
MTTPVRSVSALFAVAALAACSSNNAGPASDAASPTPDGADPSGITYWMAPRTSEVDLQLVTTRPTQGF